MYCLKTIANGRCSRLLTCISATFNTDLVLLFVYVMMCLKFLPVQDFVVTNDVDVAADKQQADR